MPSRTFVSESMPGPLPHRFPTQYVGTGATSGISGTDLTGLAEPKRISRLREPLATEHTNDVRIR